MGVPAEKATNAAQTAAEELRYVLEVLEHCEGNIYQEGETAILECEALIGKIKGRVNREDGDDGDS